MHLMRLTFPTPSLLSRSPGLLVKSLVLLAIGFMTACSTVSPSMSTAHRSTDRVWQAEDQLKWASVTIPGKALTKYSLSKVSADGTSQRSLHANANASASMLHNPVHFEPSQFSTLSFSWLVAQLIEGADMTHREHSDSPVRLILAFDGDRNKFSTKNAMLSELTHALTGQPMPYATLMYVWSNDKPVNNIIPNNRTDRIQKIVVESGATRLNQWLTYERNIKADFEKAFGEPPGALMGIGLMTDSDNTRSHAQAWYGTIELK